MKLGERTSPRPHGRRHDELRAATLVLGTAKFAEGSALIDLGDTRVLVTASVEDRVPPFLTDRGQGWVTAEYAMLPRATLTRTPRDSARGRPSGRSSEIQRLVGRSLRAAVDLTAMPDRTVTLDCDVLQADGGTRTAAITAAYAALVEAMARLYLTGEVTRWPVREPVAAISVGIVQGASLLDLEYVEDQAADVDLNVVGTRSGELVEIQGTGEGRCFSRQELGVLLDLAQAGLGHLFALQAEALMPVLKEVGARRTAGPRQAPAKSEKDLWGPP